MRPRLCITLGDPAGIGPEIAVKALQEAPLYQKCIPILVGDGFVIRDALRLSHLSLNVSCIEKPEYAVGEFGTVEFLETAVLKPDEYIPGKVSRACGEAGFRAVTDAIGYAKSHSVAGVVTGPINKEAMHLAGHMYAGHTEIFADYTGTKDYAMMLMSGNLRVIHCTTHVSLRNACDLITQPRVERVIELADQALRMMGLQNYTIGVAGLNPHSSENGLFGNEEEKKIIPAILASREKGIPVEGPVPPDTVFVKALAGQYACVVAMYHDQGHIPLKLMGFRMDSQTGAFSSMSGINMTVGLPIIRTSVDHGTAFDRAGKNLANPQSMIEAIELAALLASGKAGAPGD